MARRDVETVRRAFELFFVRGDLDAVFHEGLATPEIEWRPSTEVPEPQRYIGRDGVAEFVRVWTQEFADWSVRLERLIDARGRVVAFAHQTARGKGSGVPVEQDFGVVVGLSKGVITDIKVYVDRGEALRAAGIADARVTVP